MGKKKDSIDYESLLEAIIKIDMYRNMKLSAFERLEKLILRSGIKGARDILKDLKNTTERFVGTISKNKRFMKYARWAAIFKTLATSGILFFVAMIYLSLFLNNPLFASIALWYPIVLLVIVIFPNAYLISDYYARTELKLMKARKSGRVAQLDKHLRDINQKLINYLVSTAFKDGKNPKDLRFKSWHLDYEKVRVARKPWLLGKYWILEPDIPEPRG